MSLDRVSREWMQALARLRANAARLRATSGRACADVMATLDVALELTETIRVEYAALQKRSLQLEAQAARSQGEMRTLIDSLPQPIVETDCSGRSVDVNRAAVALLGVSAARLKDELLLHFSQDRGAFTDMVRNLPRDGQPVRAAARFRPRDRAPFDAAITILRDPRSGDDRWLWLFDRLSAAQTPTRTPVPAAVAPSPSDLYGM
jgi:PAS domain-containing protein